MKDEEYVFRQDTKEKSLTARGARYRRTHTGKGGRVRFPSDNLSKKELQAMNGKVESYRLNDPMKWDEFKALPDDLKISYIKLLREKYNVPGKYIAEMMGTNVAYYSNEICRLGISEGKNSRGRCTPWDREGFLAWCNGAPVPAADPVEETPEVAEQPEEDQRNESAPDPEVKVLPVRKERAIPASGSMTFEGSVESILNTLSVLLGGTDVHISITWDVLAEEGGCREP